ncbi:MAG TPA: DEAD/DEAH box helicase [Bacillota bacterium]|nr:DEAD/DEAH box helicase [Bacillota bacterium]
MYKNGRVSDVLYDVNHSVWTANVLDAGHHFVEMNIENVEEGSIKAYCDCTPFQVDGLCAHNVAAFLAIADKKNQLNDRFDKDQFETTRMFMNELTVPMTPVEELEYTQKTPLHVSYMVSWTFDKKIQIECKVGESRMYVIKDLPAFLQAVFHDEEVVFTKHFTYHPDIHSFLHIDLEMMRTLQSIIDNERIYEGHIQSDDFQQGERRYITIPPMLIQPLFKRLEERDFSVSMRGTQVEHVSISTDEIPFSFRIHQDEHAPFVLSIDQGHDVTYFPLYHMLYADGIFYFPTEEQREIVEQVTNLGEEYNQLPVTRGDASRFFSEVVPAFKRVGIVDVEDDVQEQLVQEPLKAHMYLEERDGEIFGKLTYRYGSFEIDPFHETGTGDTVIVRDSSMEQQIMHVIEQANFKYNGKELYIGEDEEELYTFLYKMLPILDKYVHVYMTSDVRNYIAEQQPIPSTSVRVNQATNLLDVRFAMEGIDDEEIDQVLHAVIEKKRFYRLRSGAVLSLEHEGFQSVNTLFEDLHIDKKDVVDGHVHMPAYRGAQIDTIIDTEKDYDATFSRLLEQLQHPTEQYFDVPENLEATLRDYQEKGFQWFKSLSTYHLGGILADDMGLGKTIQSISFMLSEPSEYPHLIIAPSSVVYNWKNECNRFAPSLSVAVMTGSKEERLENISKMRNTDVWITSYATIRQDIEHYAKLQFQTLFLDEAQYIKNVATKTSQAVRTLQATNKFALTGTPIENSIDELWAIFQAIMPGFMPPIRAFRQMDKEKIVSQTRPFILRRLKEDVLKELPDKIETVYISELTKDQKELYMGYLKRLQDEAATTIAQGGFQQQRMKILAGITRLRQICCHPSLFVENYTGTSGKLEQLLETIATSIENGKRMLVFSQFTSMHEIIKEKLAEKGVTFFYLHGQTPAEERVRMSEQFNKGEGDVFLISLRAGGTGLNLTGADTVILYDLWWNPAVEDQATGRAHRFGQKKVVQVIRLIAEGTIEERIFELQQQKRALMDQVVQPGETMLSSLSEEDIRSILHI